MANSEHAELALDVIEALQDEGQVVTFSRDVGGTHDPVLGSTAGATPTTWTANALRLDYKTSEIDGTVVQIGDSKLFCEYPSTDVSPDDLCTVDGDVYRVMNSYPFSPAGTGIFSRIQLRK